jgi:hypothetical protein
MRHLTMMTLCLLSGTRLSSMPPIGGDRVTRDTRSDHGTPALARGALVPCWRAALPWSLKERRKALENLGFQTSQQVNSR